MSARSKKGSIKGHLAYGGNGGNHSKAHGSCNGKGRAHMR